MKMKFPANLSVEKQFITRQYSEKWKFCDYNEVIKKLQCNHILSFSSCSFPTDSQDNYDVPVSTCKFSNKNKDILAVANENGIVCIQNIKKIQALQHVQTHKNTVYDIAWMPGNTQFVTVSGDNSAKLWDCQESQINLISTFMGHKRSVRCVSFKPENTSVFATGSRDGTLMLWDVRAWKKCAKFSHHLPDQIILSGAGSSCTSVRKNNFSVETLNSRSVTGLVFQNDFTLISCGSTDRFIRVWDMRKTYSRSASNTIAKYQLASPNSGFSYLCMNTLGTKLYANCMDSYIYCFNINSYDSDPVAAFYGHVNGSFYVKSSVNSDGSYLMSGSSDEKAYIWHTRSAELSENAVKPFLVLNSHTAEVTCVEMCHDNMVVVSCSDDGTFRVWNPFNSKTKSDEDKIDFASFYDVENVTTVKIQWKNKRKFKDLEGDTEYAKSSECPSHTKICRFYNVNHSSPCICYQKLTTGKGEKRTNQAICNDTETMVKRVALEMQQKTPPRSDNPKNIIPRHLVMNATPKLYFAKVSLKRKLDETPEFREEAQKCKKINSGVSTCLNLLGKNKSESPTTKVLQKSQKTSVNILDRDSGNDRNEETKSPLSLLSSPTSNLPNYVKDGTSPYIHKCPKIVQKENDWLTKLRKTYKVSEFSKGKSSSPNSNFSAVEKTKKNKSVEYTLHKYFKVSGKVDKSFSGQELQRKNILTEVDA